MEYGGKLYGKIGGSYFPLYESTEDVELLRKKALQRDELLEMLQEFVRDFDNGLIEDFQIPRDRFEQLILKSTEL